jgi:hypothetical protein
LWQRKDITNSPICPPSDLISGRAFDFSIGELTFLERRGEMKKVLNATVSIILALQIFFIQACATICQPGPDRIPVNSKPDGADVYLDGLLLAAHL